MDKAHGKRYQRNTGRKRHSHWDPCSSHLVCPHRNYLDLEDRECYCMLMNLYTDRVSLGTNNAERNIMKKGIYNHYIVNFVTKLNTFLSIELSPSIFKMLFYLIFCKKYLTNMMPVPYNNLKTREVIT